LSHEISGVRLLGQLDFSPRDVDKLATFIGRQITHDVHQGTEFLKEHAPSSLACFLVWEGVLNYQGGDYWSVVRDATGLSDPNWQSKWGQIFINFLGSKGLPLLEIPGAHRYITPILAHGGIPDYCLNDFFGRVLLPMVRNLPDPDDLNSVLQELRIYREEISEKNKIEIQLKELMKRKVEAYRELNRSRALIAVSDQLQRIKEFEEKAGKIEEIAGIPENPSRYIADKLEEMKRVRESLRDIDRIRIVCMSLCDVHDQVCTFAQQMSDQIQSTKEELESLVSSFKTRVEVIAPH
jgi:hypothetical protein